MDKYEVDAIDETEFFRRLVASLRIVILALMMGVTMFGVIAFVSARMPEPAKGEVEPPPKFPSLIVLPVLIGGLAGAVFIPRIVAAGARKQIRLGQWREDKSELTDTSVPAARNEREYLAFAFRTGRIISAALLEGPAFLALVIYMINGEQWLLGVAAAQVVILGLQFPTVDGVTQWVDGQDSLASREPRI